MAEWYVMRKGATTGPHSEAEVRQWLDSGQLGPEDLVNRVGTPEWVRPAAVPEFAPTAAPTAPPAATAPPPAAYPPPPAAPSQGPNAGTWFSEAWRLFADNAGVAISLQLVYLAVFLVALGILAASGVPTGIFSQRHAAGSSVEMLSFGSLLLGLLLCSLFLAVMLPALALGLSECYWDLLRTGRLSAEKLFWGVRRFWSVLALNIILFALLAVASGLTAGTAGVGGAISAVLGWAVAAWLHLALYDMAARETGAIEALGAAWQLIQKDFGNVLLLAFVSAVAGTVGVMLCCVGALVTTPLVHIAWGCCYRDLSRQ